MSEENGLEAFRSLGLSAHSDMSAVFYQGVSPYCYDNEF